MKEQRAAFAHTMTGKRISVFFSAKEMRDCKFAVVSNPALASPKFFFVRPSEIIAPCGISEGSGGLHVVKKKKRRICLMGTGFHDT